MTHHDRRRVTYRAMLLACTVFLTACSGSLNAPTPTLVQIPFSYDCTKQPFDPKQSSTSPSVVYIVGKGVAISFADQVQRYADLIVVGTVREVLPPRWDTPDGRRPDQPNTSKNKIFTPVRIEVEQVAKGSHDQRDLYFAELGGRIGQDCAYYGGSGATPSFNLGQRYLYIVMDNWRSPNAPLPGDGRLRFYTALRSYAVSRNGNITIGPEHDIMRNAFDDPPRTVPLADALREINVLLGKPSPTPTR